MTEQLRLTEILTTSSAVANYLGAPTVMVGHVIAAIGILKGTVTLDDLGRPQSPLLSRVTGAGSGADAAVQAVAQRWFAALGNDPLAELDAEQLAAFEAELAELTS